MPFLSATFLILLLLVTFTRFWLGARQIRHVQTHRKQVPEEFSEKISLRSHHRAADYTVARVRLGRIEILLDALILLVMTLGGGLQWLWTQTQNMISGTLLPELVFMVTVFLIISALHLPISLYRQFRLEERFGFNRMTLKLYISDLLKGLLLGALLGIPLSALILWLMEMAGTYWWLWAWAVWTGFNILMLLIFPTWIAPLFNKFTPLDDEELRTRVHALAKRCQFSIQGLFVMDGSRRSAHGNAYFTGLGKSRRIVFFDTLLKKLTPEEIEAVLAHELGHFKHHHITRRMILSLLAALVFFGALGWLAQSPWFYEALGVQSVDQAGAMALVLFMLVMPIFTFWLTPVMNGLSRRDEYEADRFAAQQSDATQLISALVKLFNDNAATLTPDPVHSAFYDSHPPANLRIQQLAKFA